jgi:hypothetical protein
VSPTIDQHGLESMRTLFDRYACYPERITMGSMFRRGISRAEKLRNSVAGQ